MSALDPAARKFVYEAIASLVVALAAAGLLFRVFFEGWTDYWQCCRRRSIFDAFSSNQPDLSDRARGFFFNVIWIGAGGLVFYCLHRIFG